MSQYVDYRHANSKNGYYEVFERRRFMEYIMEASFWEFVSPSPIDFYKKCYGK